jgi:streptogramin lyase
MYIQDNRVGSTHKILVVLILAVSLMLGGCEKTTNGSRQNTSTPPKDVPGIITQFAVPTPNSSPGGFTLGPDGNLWFTESDILNGSKIGRLTPQGKITEFAVPTPNSSPLDITLGPDGNLWFTENSRNKIGRITPERIVTEFALPPLPLPGSEPQGITQGPDGNLWFAEWGTNQIGRMTPKGAVTEFAVPTPVGHATPLIS